MTLDQKTREADRVYEEFEPPTDWDRDEGSDTQILMLPGFKKEQLKVQVTSTRVLRVSGERQISENKWRRFRKESSMPPDSDTSGISAKFEAGMLYVRLPKVINNKQQNGPTATQEAPKPQQPTTRQASKPQQPTARQTSKTQQPTTQEAPKLQQPTTQEAPKPQQPIKTDQKPNNDEKKPRELEDKSAESKKEVLQEPKADEEDYSPKKPQEEKEKSKARIITDEDVDNKLVAKERVAGAMAAKVEETHQGIGSDGLGKISREGKMERRSLTMEMLSIQSQEYMAALSGLVEEVKKQKKLVNVLLVIFFVLLFGLFVKNAIKSSF